MNLGKSRQDIFNKLTNVVKAVAKKGLLKEGPNNIETVINGYKVTIRPYVENGVIKNINGFIGWPGRTVKNLIKW